MTVAATVFKKNRLVIGADTLFSFGDTCMPGDNHNASKIFTVNDTYIAGSGWGLYDNIFQDILSDKKNKNLKLHDEKSIFKFLGLLGLLCINQVDFGSLINEVMTLSMRYS